MATIFVSHSSKDHDIVQHLENWLISNGFDDLFVDHSNIRGGDKWPDALRQAKAACRVVLCVVTQQWLASHECFGEFTAAFYQGKRIVPLFMFTSGEISEDQQKRLARVRAEDQGFDISRALVNGELDLDALPELAEPLKAGLRAGGALAKVGLDPEAFEIDHAIRPSPFPGLESFGDEDADAAIFYGRSPEIARCLEDLREMRANGARQPYIILGASGSGKSSLMKAGVLPRLRRERGWVVLRALRPGAAPLFNFALSMAHTFADYDELRAPGEIRDDLYRVWQATTKGDGFASQSGLLSLHERIEFFLDQLRKRAGRPPITFARLSPLLWPSRRQSRAPPVFFSV